jgi:hypothetical protein
MRSRFSSWGLSVLTMVSVATVVLLVTGWGSAVAASVQSVLVTNTAANPVPVAPTGTVPVHEQGTAKVSEQNLDGNGNIKVHEQGTANVNVTNTAALPVSGTVSVGNLPATQPVSGTVSVDNFPANFPAAPTTDVIQNLSGHTPANGFYTVLNEPDSRAYRAVTIYLQFAPAPASGSGQDCSFNTFDPAGHQYLVDSFQTGTSNFFTKSYDPAPPRVAVVCHDTTGNGIDWNSMLTGRTS